MRKDLPPIHMESTRSIDLDQVTEKKIDNPFIVQPNRTQQLLRQIDDVRIVSVPTPPRLSSTGSGYNVLVDLYPTRS